MEPIKALIVEDVARMAERMKDLVEAAGASVVATSATEDEALEICDRFALELAVVDLQLAQGTGFGVIRRLRQTGRVPCCVVVITNHAVPALKVAAFEAGADYFLDKAKDWEALSRIVRELAESEASA
jgi:two-component system OmpR family response regulator